MVAVVSRPNPNLASARPALGSTRPQATPALDDPRVHVPRLRGSDLDPPSLLLASNRCAVFGSNAVPAPCEHMALARSRLWVLACADGPLPRLRSHSFARDRSTRPRADRASVAARQSGSR